MPSYRHEAIDKAFRTAPELCARVLRDFCGVELPPFDSVETDSETLSVLRPLQRVADGVLRFRYKGVPVFAVILEAQLRIDPDKPKAWCISQAIGADVFGCPTCVLVITPSPVVAKWASEPYISGPGASHRALVFGPGNIPFPRAPLAPNALPELVLLSALAHGHTRNRKEAKELATTILQALVAIGGVDPELMTIYYDIVTAALGAAVRAALEDLMSSTKQGYKNPITEKLLAMGEARGRVEGEARGEARGKVEMLLLVIEARGITLAAAQRRVIEACTDVDRLDRWAKRAVSATSADGLLSDDA